MTVVMQSVDVVTVNFKTHTHINTQTSLSSPSYNMRRGGSLNAHVAVVIQRSL